MTALHKSLGNLHHVFATVTPSEPRVETLSQQSKVAQHIKFDSKVEQHDFPWMVMMPQPHIHLYYPLTTMLPVFSDSRLQHIIIFVLQKNPFEAISHLQQHIHPIMLRIRRILQFPKMRTALHPQDTYSPQPWISTLENCRGHSNTC